MLEVGARTCAANNDILWADSTALRLKMCNNGGAAVQIVGSGQDINASDQVTQVHFGATATLFSGTPPTTNQYLQWNGTNIVGSTLQIDTPWSVSLSASYLIVAFGTVGETNIPHAHTLQSFTVFLATGVSCSTYPTIAFYDETASSALSSITITGSQYFSNTGLSVAMTGGHNYSFRVTGAGSGCTGGGTASVALTAIWQ